jgi:hypothetical protein
MDTQVLPEAIEPDTWNVVFHPSATRLGRRLGRFKHVSAFAYVPGFRAWLICDVQWSGLRLCLFSHEAAMRLFTHYTADCTLVMFTRQHHPMMLASRLGFYCVPAVKCLLGLSCVAVTPDGLYRYLVKHGGCVLGARGNTAAAAARPEPGAGAAVGAS